MSTPTSVPDPDVTGAAQRNSRILAGAAVVTPGGVLDPGWVEISGDTIAAVGRGKPPPGRVEDLGGAWLLPGFVDLHVHGGGGFDMTASTEQVLAALEFHRRHGTTRTLASLVTAPLPDLTDQLERIAALTQGRGPVRGRLLGAHLEGPFLSHDRRGAQHPAHLLSPDRGTLRTLLRAGHGTVRVVTVAPELPGAAELIADIRAAGAVTAVGHSDADYDQARAAFVAGATLVTHLFNGMRPLHHRDPGLIGATLEAPVAYELILDGVHVHPSAARAAVGGAGEPVLITDAIAAAGRPDGDYLLGGQPVTVREGVARVRRSGSLAGSTLTMDQAVRRAVHDVGMSMAQASRAASGAPAAVLGLEHRFGSIAPGLAADLVVLDDRLMLTMVITAGLEYLAH